jgi:ribonuclease HII
MSESLSLDYEQQYWRQGIAHLAGIDEAGMGALAGPVVAAAVVFKASLIIDESSPVIRDSKLLSVGQREKAAAWIKAQALSWGVGEASVADITELNIRGASHLAMRRAIAALAPAPELLLVDGTPAQIHDTITIIDGDAIVFSIAAASILAKVHRDAIMARLDQEFPEYQWGSNKGYGSRLHMAMLDSYGPTPHHRPTYAPVARLLTR